MAKITTKLKENPKLEQRLMSDGKISLYLEYYFGRTQEQVLDEYGEPVVYESGKMKGKPKVKTTHIRKKENLHLYLIATPKTPFDREHNKEVLMLANKIRQEREQEFLENKEGYRLKKKEQLNFLDYFQNYIDKYKKKDIRSMKGVFKRFKDFLNETPEYNQFANYLKPGQITKEMMSLFVEYLQSKSKGEGALSYYRRFRKVILYAYEQEVLKKDPCKGISIKTDKNTLKKDILSQDEIKQLISTHCRGENKNIRRAFIFCLYSGIRFCDVKELTFSNVDYSNKLLKYIQNKTKGHSTHSSVVIPLNDSLLNIIGKPKEGETPNTLIFPLPSHTMCLKALRNWTAKAGITKHITWHCARHSFATNILSNGANVKVVAELLGHSSIEMTEKYVRAVDSLKQDAINSLPTIKDEIL